MSLESLQLLLHYHMCISGWYRLTCTIHVLSCKHLNEELPNIPWKKQAWKKHKFSSWKAVIDFQCGNKPATRWSLACTACSNLEWVWNWWSSWGQSGWLGQGTDLIEPAVKVWGPRKGSNMRWPQVWCLTGLDRETKPEMISAQYHNLCTRYSISVTIAEMTQDTQKLQLLLRVASKWWKNWRKRETRMLAQWREARLESEE